MILETDYSECKSINEMQRSYFSKQKELKDDFTETLKNRLKEIHLDGLVRRKRDGAVGWLVACGVEIDFHLRTKSGAPSKNASGLTWVIEEEYEPFKEGETE